MSCKTAQSPHNSRRLNKKQKGDKLHAGTKPDGKSTPITLTSTPQGGYDLDFLETPLELTCSICQLVLRDPHLTSCCGSHYCKSCIETILSKFGPCPLCRSPSFETFLDKSFQRRVSELGILCPLSENGCTWTGTVGTASSHLYSDCEYFEINCDLCKVEVQRNKHEEHKRDECPNRPFTCVYCGYAKTWVDVSKHHKRCGNFPLQCPNECGIGVIERKSLNTHVKALCPLQIEPCDFQFAGCSAQFPRKDKVEHFESNTTAHLSLLAGVFADYKNTLEAKQEEVCELQSTVKSLKDVIKSHDSMIFSLNQKLSQLQVSRLGPNLLASFPPTVFPPVDLYLQNLTFFKQTNQKWVSGPFYTHPGGYKMCLTVHANGIGKAKSSPMFISVFANIMKGESDGDLEWPFWGEVVVCLHLEPSEDIIKTLIFSSKSHVKAVQRVTERDLNDFGQGDFHFAHHSKISSLNNLHFTVLRVNWRSSH